MEWDCASDTSRHCATGSPRPLTKLSRNLPRLARSSRQRQLRRSSRRERSRLAPSRAGRSTSWCATPPSSTESATAKSTSVGPAFPLGRFAACRRATPSLPRSSRSFRWLRPRACGSSSKSATTSARRSLSPTRGVAIRESASSWFQSGVLPSSSTPYPLTPMGPARHEPHSSMSSNSPPAKGVPARHALPPSFGARRPRPHQHQR